MLGKRRAAWVLRLLIADGGWILASFLVAYGLRVLLDRPLGRAAAPLQHYLWLPCAHPAGVARQTAERALALNPREWLAWAVVARSARELGDVAAAEHAVGKARELTPLEARGLLDAVLP